MELIRISDCKLKIMLTQEDLDEFDLRADELDYADGSTRSMFRCLLHRVQRLTDFDTMRLDYYDDRVDPRLGVSPRQQMADIIAYCRE